MGFLIFFGVVILVILIIVSKSFNTSASTQDTAATVITPTIIPVKKAHKIHKRTAYNNKIGPDTQQYNAMPNSEAIDDNQIFNAVEVQPTFPGGESAFSSFLHEEIIYPYSAKQNNITGRVFVQFVVERDGSLTDIKTLRDPGNGLGNEALRVMKNCPHWNPGIQNGKSVRVMFTVPINFSLPD